MGQKERYKQSKQPIGVVNPDRRTLRGSDANVQMM